MSLFLGNIHYWLYNKIQWFEELEADIIKLAKESGLMIDVLVKEVAGKYGAPVGQKPLEEIIDTSNIHGWLQERIQSAELRQAAIITNILKEKPELKEDLAKLFTTQGAAAAREYGETPAKPEEIFKAMNDFLLEGMPCDRVNEVVSNDDNKFVWKTTMCLHKPYWDEVKGNVQNFYDLREAWIKAFVKEMSPSFQYEKEANNINNIIRK